MLIVLLWLWQLPQNLLGAVVRDYYALICEHFYMLEWTPKYEMYETTLNTTFTLGRYVFIGLHNEPKVWGIMYNRVDLSRKLGPLYLPYRIGQILYNKVKQLIKVKK